jgi:hypothetical protein
MQVHVCVVPYRTLSLLLCFVAFVEADDSLPQARHGAQVYSSSLPTRSVFRASRLPTAGCEAPAPCVPQAGPGGVSGFTPAIQQEFSRDMVNVIVLQPLIALVAGILILLIPRLLNLIVAIYLIAVGVTGLWPHLLR